MFGSVQDQVVVVTGASSGIGRAAALRFAQNGAKLVLAARRKDVLEELAEECRRAGTEALAVPTDVSDLGAVLALAERAVATHGRIDVWVNNAGVSMFGRFEEAPMEDFRRVVDTNLYGYIHGARAVIPYFREQGTGILINNGSIAGVVGQPYTSAYCVTKFAIRGLGECLRQELIGEPIHVSTILPASIDTPLFQNAANHTGRAIKPLDPVYDAEDVADAIVRAACYPMREIVVGNAGRALALLHRLSPGLAERLMASQVESKHFQGRPAERSSGNLFEPSGRTDVSGGWKPRPRGAPLPPVTRHAAVPAGAVAAALVAGIVVAGLAGRSASHNR